jgi:hypothetical protein
MSQSKRYAPAREVRRRYPEAICRTGLNGFSVLVGQGHAHVLATGKSRGMAWRSAASRAEASSISPARVLPSRGYRRTEKSSP